MNPITLALLAGGSVAAAAYALMAEASDRMAVRRNARRATRDVGPLRGPRR
jgi:hypothetical protein